MINKQCIYCNEEKLLNEEHAFPDALRQENTPNWTIKNHLCENCNSKLGSELDAPLVGSSHIASVFDLILLHEPSSVDPDAPKCVIGFNALRPQLVLTQYSKGKKGKEIITQNHLNMDCLNIERYTDLNAKADVLRLDKNTHVFTLNATNYYLKSIAEFKSNFITDSPCTQYDFMVIYPEDEGYQKKVTEFLAELEGGEKR